MKDPIYRKAIILDDQNPWPGLKAFSEENATFFYGREKEIEDLSRLVRQEQLVVLFGRSGVGKSSLLRAGLSPELLKNQFLPIHVRLNHQEETLPLEDQVEVHIEQALEAYQIDAPKPIREETLWEYFHKKNTTWWDQDNRLIKPVLIFDQFEELLIAGQETQARVVRSANFLRELEDLVQNRPPEKLVQRFKSEKGLAQNYDFETTHYRVILSFREDFLADFEVLRSGLRQIMFNRYRLRAMTDQQAMQVILGPGKHLVDEPVAQQIIDFVATSNATPGMEGWPGSSGKKTMEPALLSVVLSELNSLRRRRGEEKISAHLIKNKRPEEILINFFDSGLQGLDQNARNFIEEHLITASGARNRVAEDNAIQHHGVSEEDIETLIDRRILQREKTGKTKWLELTHDKLTHVVGTSAQTRLRSKKIRKRAFAAGLSILLIMATMSVIFYIQRQKQQAQTEEAAKLALDLAKTLEGDPTLNSEAERSLIDKLDAVFKELSKSAGNSDLFRSNYAQFLLINAGMYMERGHFGAAKPLIDGASKLVFQPNLRIASPFLKAEIKLNEGLILHMQGTIVAAQEAFDKAEALLINQASAESNSKPANQLLGFRLANAQIQFLRDQMKLNDALNLAYDEREKLNRFRSKNAKADSEFLRPYFIQLFKLDLAIAKCRVALRLDITKAHEDFRSDLGLSQKFFSGANQQKWHFYNALCAGIKAEALESNATIEQVLASHDFAISTLADLATQHSGNLLLRFHLGHALLNRALFSKADTTSQIEFDLKSAKTLAISIQRDSKNPYLALKLNLFRDLVDGQITMVDKKAKSASLEAYQRLLTRIAFHRQHFEKQALLDAFAFFGFYGRMKIYADHNEPKPARKNTQDALELLTKYDNDSQRYYIASRRVPLILTILSLDSKRLADNKWNGFYQRASEDCKRMLEQFPSDPSWLSQTIDLRLVKGNYLKTKGKFDNAASTYRQALEMGLTILKTHPKREQVRNKAIYATTQAVKALHQVGDWSQILDTLALAQQLVPTEANPSPFGAKTKYTNWLRTQTVINSAINSASQTADSALLQQLKSAKVRAQETLNYLKKNASIPHATGNDHLPPMEIAKEDDNTSDIERTEPIAWSTPPLYPASWQTLTSDEQDEILGRIGFGKSGVKNIRQTTLPFYKNARLIDIEKVDQYGKPSIYSYVLSKQVPFQLDGDSSTLQEINEKASIHLKTSGDVVAYLRFFYPYFQKQTLVEHSSELNWLKGASLKQRSFANGRFRPIVVWKDEDNPNYWSATATGSSGYNLFHVTLLVNSDGNVEIKNILKASDPLPLFPIEIKNGAWQSAHSSGTTLDLSFLGIDEALSEIDSLHSLILAPAEQRPEHYIRLAQDAATLTYSKNRILSDVKSAKGPAEITRIAAKFLIGNGIEAEVVAKEVILDLIKKIEQLKRKPEKDPDLATHYLNLAWYRLFTKDFTGAIEASNLGKKIKPDLLSLDTNLAHGLLLGGRTKEAMAIYQANIGKKIDGRLWEQIIEKDFEVLKKNNIHHPKMDTVRWLFKTLREKNQDQGKKPN